MVILQIPNKFQFLVPILYGNSYTSTHISQLTCMGHKNFCYYMIISRKTPLGRYYSTKRLKCLDSALPGKTENLNRVGENTQCHLTQVERSAVHSSCNCENYTGRNLLHGNNGGKNIEVHLRSDETQWDTESMLLSVMLWNWTQGEETRWGQDINKKQIKPLSLCRWPLNWLGKTGYTMVVCYLTSLVKGLDLPQWQSTHLSRETIE